MKLLEPENIIYGKNRIYGISEVLTVERVTATQAICKKAKFKREINNNGEVRIIGEDFGGFNKTHYYLETDELKEEFIRQQLIRKLGGCDYSKLSTDILKKIDLLLNNNQ